MKEGEKGVNTENPLSLHLMKPKWRPNYCKAKTVNIKTVRHCCRDIAWKS